MDSGDSAVQPCRIQSYRPWLLGAQPARNIVACDAVLDDPVMGCLKSRLKQMKAPGKHPRSYHRVTENDVTRLHVLNVLGHLQYFSDPRAPKDDGRLTMPVVKLP